MEEEAAAAAYPEAAEAVARHHTAMAALQLPTHYGSVAEAAFPCVLKAARGEYGRGVRIVRSADEARLCLGGRGGGDGRGGGGRGGGDRCGDRGDGGAASGDVGGVAAEADESDGAAEAEESSPDDDDDDDYSSAQPSAAVVTGEGAPGSDLSEAVVAGEGAPGSDWLLQELVRGAEEHSTSLLVVEGRLLRAEAVVYTYAAAEYIWPHVREKKELRRFRSWSHGWSRGGGDGDGDDGGDGGGGSGRGGEAGGDASTEMEAALGWPAGMGAAVACLLEGYTGVCNLNHKERPNAATGRQDGSGGHALLEVNTRVGGDLAKDVPRPRAAAFFEAIGRIAER